MVISNSSISRFHGQMELILQLLKDLDGETTMKRPGSGKWSIHENLAHLGRYHEVFSNRLERILNEDQPLFDRYKAEEDSGTQSWMAITTNQVLDRMQAQRLEIGNLLTGLNDQDLIRTGNHPKLGTMTIPFWFEFFLLHESHHVYAIFCILGEFRSSK